MAYITHHIHVQKYSLDICSNFDGCQGNYNKSRKKNTKGRTNENDAATLNKMGKRELIQEFMKLNQLQVETAETTTRILAHLSGVASRDEQFIHDDIVHGNNDDDSKDRLNTISSSLCSFDICANHPDAFNLFSKDESKYYLLSNSLRLLSSSNPPTKEKCSVAFLISGMPFSGEDIQMALLEDVITNIESLNFRGFVYWNFHAHGKLQDDDARMYVKNFDRWASTLKRRDAIIVRTPYKDDMKANGLCERSIIINSYRPLSDVSHFWMEDNQITLRDGLNDSNKPIFDFIRSMLLHQRHWFRKADIKLNFPEMIMSSDGLLFFANKICDAISSIMIANECNAKILIEGAMKNPIVSKTIEEYSDRESLINGMEIQLDQDRADIERSIQENFRAWISTTELFDWKGS